MKNADLKANAVFWQDLKMVVDEAVLKERERLVKLIEDYVLPADDSGGEPIIWNRAIHFAADLVRRSKKAA